MKKILKAIGSVLGVLVMSETMSSGATSPIDLDFPWIMGMFSASEIRMAKIN